MCVLVGHRGEAGGRKSARSVGGGAGLQVSQLKLEKSMLSMLGCLMDWAKSKLYCILIGSTIMLIQVLHLLPPEGNVA